MKLAQHTPHLCIWCPKAAIELGPYLNLCMFLQEHPEATQMQGNLSLLSWRLPSSLMAGINCKTTWALYSSIYRYPPSAPSLSSTLSWS